MKTRFIEKPHQFIFIAAIFYSVLYWFFFNLSAFIAGLTEFSLWFVAAGLRFVFLLRFGWRSAIYVVAAEVSAQGAAGEWAEWGPGNLGWMILGVSAPVVAYSTIIYVLDRSASKLNSTQHWRLSLYILSAMLAAPLLAAPMSIYVLFLANRVALDVALSAGLSFWVGDLIGILFFGIPALWLMSRWGDLGIPYIGYRWMSVSSDHQHQIISSNQHRYALLLLPFSILGFAAIGFPADPLYWFPAYGIMIIIVLSNGWIGAVLSILTFNALSAYVATHTIGAADRLALQAFLILFSISAIILAAAIRDRELKEIDRRRYFEQLLHMNRRETIGDATASLVHEIAQPLSALSIYTQEALHQIRSIGADAPDGLRQWVEKAAFMSDRVNDITTNIHILMRSSLGPKQQFPAKDVVASAIWLGTQGNPSAVRVTWHENTYETLLNGHSTLIQQAIINLLSNSIKYTSRSEIPDERPSIELLISQDRLLIIFSNCLSDAEPHQLPVEIGNPYNSGSKEGLGIGLHLTRAIAEEHGGSLKYNVSPDNWFRAELALPISSNGEQR